MCKTQTLKERRRQRERQRKIMGISLILSLLLITVTVFGKVTSKEEETVSIPMTSVEVMVTDSHVQPMTYSNTDPITVEKLELEETSSASFEEEEIVPEEDTKETEEKKKKTKKSEKHKGEEKWVPDYCGSVHPYMGWSCITSRGTAQYKLRMECEAYDENGFGVINGRFAVAVKPYYGNIGDYIDVIQNDGLEYHCVIVDHKGMENKDEDGWLATYAHWSNDIVEFVVNKSSWYGTDKTVEDFYPEYRKNIKVVYNVGNYWD